MISISHLTERVKFLSLVFIISLIAACNSDINNNSDNDVKIHKQTFLMGNGPYSMEIIRELIDKSGIRFGGYVVIIPTSFNNNKSDAIDLRNHFYFDEVTAVHILDFQSDSSIKKTDLLAIENASIICIQSGKRNKFMKLANNSDLKKSVHTAYNNGCLIAGNGNGASILGDYYYAQVKDTKTNKSKLLLKPGLSIIENAVIEVSSLLQEHGKEIKIKCTEKNLMFIGLDRNSALWIDNKNAMVLSKSGVSYLESATPLKRYKYQQKFSLSIK